MNQSTAWLQTKVREAVLQERFTTGDPEHMIDRISLIQSIETAYYRGAIDWTQIRILEEWCNTGVVLDRYALLAALFSIAVTAGYTDEAFLKHYEQLREKGKLSEEEVAQALFTLSEELTISLI